MFYWPTTNSVYCNSQPITEVFWTLFFTVHSIHCSSICYMTFELNLRTCHNNIMRVGVLALHPLPARSSQ